MQWLSSNIKWIMIVTGALTCTMLFAAVAPQAALQATFGTTLDGPLADIVVRNWGLLIALVGALLIHGAYRPANRPLILSVAITSKLTFILLVLVYGQAYLGHAAVALVFDFLVIVVFVAYLINTRQTKPAS